jgi:chromosome segregation ATPase
MTTTIQEDAPAWALQLIRSVNTLVAEEASLKTEMASVKTEMASVKTEMASVKTEISSLKTEMASVNCRMQRMDDDINQLRILQGNLRPQMSDDITILRNDMYVSRMTKSRMHQSCSTQARKMFTV